MSALAVAAMVIMARHPTRAPVKTRLAPALSAEERSMLYRAFLLDRVDQVCRLRGVLPCVAFTPAEARRDFAELVGPRVRLLQQRGADLGERLTNASAALFDAGCAAVLLVDSDTPTLPTGVLQQAVHALLGPAKRPGAEAADVVLGPAADGGYYLIGTRRPRPCLFEGIAWSTAQVLEQTMARAEGAALSVELLPPWYDIDTPDDLRRLAEELCAAGAPRADGPRRTEAVLGSWQTIARSSP